QSGCEFSSDLRDVAHRTAAITSTIRNKMRDSPAAAPPRMGMPFAPLCEKVAVAQPSTPFDSIESAHEYIRLLCEAVDEAEGTIEREITYPCAFTGRRHLDALRL